MFPIKYGNVAVECPQCRRPKSVYFLAREIGCFLCSWMRKRAYPVPEPKAEIISIGPLSVPSARV